MHVMKEIDTFRTSDFCKDNGGTKRNAQFKWEWRPLVATARSLIHTKYILLWGGHVRQSGVFGLMAKSSTSCGRMLS